MAQEVTKSILKDIIKQEILKEKGVQTRKVFTEKYTMAQRKKDLMNMVFASVMKQYNKYTQENG